MDTHGTTDDRLALLRKQEEEELMQILSVKYGIPYADLTVTAIDPTALKMLTEDESRAAQVAVIEKIGTNVVLALHSPNTPLLVDVMDKLTRNGINVSQVLVSNNSLNHAWSRFSELSYSREVHAGAIELSGSEVTTLISDIHTIADVSAALEELASQSRAYRISRILEIILAGGFSLHASDIHVEPEEDSVRLRYRLDGVLTTVHTFDHETYSLFLSRVKLLSGLKLNVAYAQDGRFSVGVREEEVEIRTSILPGDSGESIVLRILNPDAINVPLEQLGIPTSLLGIILKAIEKPTGLILTTGPTGSGKTTTLYAFLRKIYTPTVKIITIEDPVEYHITGITQTQVDHEAYTFDSGLRAALRQDPDVIMIGEIRDEEVAHTAVNAALTGHLVFSTLHTNSAAGTFPRMLDLKIDPKVLGSAVSLVLAQRLVRTLCKACATTSPVTDAELATLKRVGDKIAAKGIPFTMPSVLPRSVGCLQCNNTGFKGRIGVYEGIVMDEAVEHLIVNNPSEREIRQVHSIQKLPTLLEDGVMKVLAGITTLEELDRVVDVEEDD